VNLLMNATTIGGELAWVYLRYPQARRPSRKCVIREALIKSVQMRKMTKFQKCLASITVSCFESGREISKTPELLNDFPEILKDAGSADSTYDRIYGNMDWGNARTDQCLVSVGDRDVTYKSEFIEIKLDLPRYFAYELIDGYEGYAAQDGKYEKEEVLDKAVSLLCDKLDYMHRDLQQTATRGLLDSHNLVIAHRRDFGGKLSLREERRESNKHFKIKFPPGRKRTPLEDSGKQAAIKLYNELRAILIPGFDKTNESVTKMKAAFDAVTVADLPDPGSRIADQLWAKKSPNQAAIYLIAQKLNKSDRHVRRWVSGK